MDKERREVRNIRKNLAFVEGIIVSPFIKSTIPDGEGLYETYMDIWRSSGTTDRIRLVVPGDALEPSRDYTWGRVSVKGRFRSCNQECGGKRRLILYIAAEEIKLVGCVTDENDVNSIRLEGHICRPPVYRRTPLGRKITDVVLAVNDPYWRSDYIPCVFWGKDALAASGLKVGDQIKVEGRAQSRKYIKKSEGKAEERTAYEISVVSLHIPQHQDKEGRRHERRTQ